MQGYQEKSLRDSKQNSDKKIKETQKFKNINDDLFFFLKVGC